MHYQAEHIAGVAMFATFAPQSTLLFFATTRLLRQAQDRLFADGFALLTTWFTVSAANVLRVRIESLPTKLNPSQLELISDFVSGAIIHNNIGVTIFAR